MLRRDLLIVGAAFAVAIAIPPILRRRAITFDFVDLEGFPGFRRLDGGRISGGVSLFAGLDGPAPAAPEGSLCDMLFGVGDKQDNRLPIAVFSDVNCPNCRVVEARLERMVQVGTPIRLVYHPLPLLGPNSVWAAKVILAAGLQGAGQAMHRDLMQVILRPGPSAVREAAARHGLDGDRLWSDAGGPQVQAMLNDSLGLGAALGIPGTPGMMIGRTLVIGAMAERDLVQLIELERELSPAAC